jgi:hypothetical protein
MKDIISLIESYSYDLSGTYYEFNLLGINYKISNADKIFCINLKSEYAYFIQPFDSKDQTIEIYLINNNNNNYKYLFLNAISIKMHSTESKTESYLKNGNKFDKRGQFRNGKIIECDDFVAILALQTDNIIFYQKGKSKIYVIGMNKHFIECKDIIENLTICHLEMNNYLMLHASCCSKNDKGVLIIGNSGQGKTTLMLYLVYKCGFDFVANDRVFVKICDTELKALSYPLQLAIGLGTFKEFKNIQRFLSNYLKGIITDRIKEMNNFKVRFQPDELNELFSNKIRLNTSLSCIILPNINLETRTKLAFVNNELCANILDENILSPYDPNHPKWLKYLLINDLLVRRNRENIKYFILKNNFRIVNITIGYDAINFFKETNLKEILYGSNN